jgi:hypothetical protein
VIATVVLQDTVLVVVGLTMFAKSRTSDKPTPAPQVVGQREKDMLNNVQHCRSH